MKKVVAEARIMNGIARPGWNNIFGRILLVPL